MSEREMTKKEKDLAKKFKAKACHYIYKWNGYNVYSIDDGYNKNGNTTPPVAGMPAYILEKDGKSRLNTTEEFFNMPDCDD